MRFLAHADFFAHPGLFFDDGFFPAQWDKDIFLLELTVSRAGVAAGWNTFDHDFLALEFDWLIDGLSPDHFAEADAAGFDLALAYFDLFFVEFDVGGFLTSAPRRCGGRRSVLGPRLGGCAIATRNPVIGAHLILSVGVQLNIRVIRRGIWRF